MLFRSRPMASRNGRPLRRGYVPLAAPCGAVAQSKLVPGYSGDHDNSCIHSRYCPGRVLVSVHIESPNCFHCFREERWKRQDEHRQKQSGDWLNPASRTMRNPKQREELHNRANGQCQRCGASVSKETMEVDHIQPYSKGGGALHSITCKRFTGAAIEAKARGNDGVATHWTTGEWERICLRLQMFTARASPLRTNCALIPLTSLTSGSTIRSIGLLPGWNSRLTRRQLYSVDRS